MQSLITPQSDSHLNAFLPILFPTERDRNKSLLLVLILYVGTYIVAVPRFGRGHFKGVNSYIYKVSMLMCKVLADDFTGSRIYTVFWAISENISMVTN